jgi:hypothetical protein
MRARRRTALTLLLGTRTGFESRRGKHCAFGSDEAPGIIPPVRRIMAPMLVLAATGGIAAGCGGGGSSTTRSKTPEATKPITNAQAAAYAHTVNLRAGDVVGMTMSGRPESETVKEKHSTRELIRCAGGVSLEHQLVDIKSPKFSRGRELQREEVGSGVSVLSSATFATRELAAVRSARGRACITRFVKQEFSKEGAGQLHLGAITTSLLPAPVAGLGGSFGLRVTVTLAAARPAIRLPLYLDFMGFVSGPAEIDLNTFAFSRPVSSATERHLLSLLLSRAKATSL